MISQFRKLEVLDFGRVGSIRGCWGGSVPCRSQLLMVCWQSLASLGLCCITPVSPFIFTWCLGYVHVFVFRFPLFICTTIGLGGHPSPTWPHLNYICNNPIFQIRAHFEVLGARTSAYDFWWRGHNSTHNTTKASILTSGPQRLFRSWDLCWLRANLQVIPEGLGISISLNTRR